MFQRNKRVFCVEIIESERGWGSKVEDIYHFDSEIEARNWARMYNTKYNPPGPAPNWYMYATYTGSTMIDEKDVNRAEPIDLGDIEGSEN